MSNNNKPTYDNVRVQGHGLPGLNLLVNYDRLNDPERYAYVKYREWLITQGLVSGDNQMHMVRVTNRGAVGIDEPGATPNPTFG